MGILKDQSVVVHLLLQLETLVGFVLPIQHQNILRVQQLQSLQHLRYSHFLSIVIVLRVLNQKVLNIRRPEILLLIGFHQLLGLLSYLRNSHFDGSCPASCEDIHINEAC